MPMHMPILEFIPIRVAPPVRSQRVEIVRQKRPWGAVNRVPVYQVDWWLLLPCLPPIHRTWFEHGTAPLPDEELRQLLNL